MTMSPIAGILHHLVSGWGMLDGQARHADEAILMLEQAAAQGRYTVRCGGARYADAGEKMDFNWPRRSERIPQGAGVRLIVLTSLIQPGHAERARRAGFTAYLTKPVRHDQLLGCLRVVFGLQTANTTNARGATSDACRTDDCLRALITRHTLGRTACPSARILVAEDNVVNQKLAVRMLDRLGYQPDIVSNGQEAVAAFDTGNSMPRS
jgi:two-component system sensor histidine kinase/response regulator